MATSAAQLRAPAARVAPSARRRSSRRRASVPVAAGVVWIAVVALLLAGVVALNVAVLRLNVELDQLGRERTDLRAENALLESQLSRAAAGAKVEALAQRSGLVPAEQLIYVRLSRKDK